MPGLEFERCYNGKKIAVTGHTGFTGGWLCLWLKSIGADVYGLSLEPATTPNLFNAIELGDQVHSRIGDICDVETTNAFFKDCQPDIVLHLAAQSIVSAGYEDPHRTFNTNVMGTLNVLEAARKCESTRAAVCVTTDKVYKEDAGSRAHCETDPLGGRDPYSASKSASEMVIHTYQHALNRLGNGMVIASARGGNIIGGGDWADNRIVPDFVRAVSKGETLTLRDPTATRPWQHVLALVHGYLMLGHRLLTEADTSIDAWNFGPNDDGERSVGDLVDILGKRWSGVEVVKGEAGFGESHFLSLNSEKARSVLGWKPPLDFAKAVEWTAEWYSGYLEAPGNAHALATRQIEAYRSML